MNYFSISPFLFGWLFRICLTLDVRQKVHIYDRKYIKSEIKSKIFVQVIWRYGKSQLLSYVRQALVLSVPS